MPRSGSRNCYYITTIFHWRLLRWIMALVITNIFSVESLTEPTSLFLQNELSFWQMKRSRPMCHGENDESAISAGLPLGRWSIMALFGNAVYRKLRILRLQGREIFKLENSKALKLQNQELKSRWEFCDQRVGNGRNPEITKFESLTDCEKLNVENFETTRLDI